MTSLTTLASWAILAASLSSASRPSSSSTSSVRSAIMAETVSPPTPKCVLMSRAISRGLASTGWICKPGQHLQLVQRVNVVGVAGGDDERAVVARQRHEGAAVDELERHGLERGRLDLDLRQIDQLHAELFGEGGEDVVLLGEPAFDEQLVERFRRGREMGLGHPRQFGFREGAALNQSLNELHCRSRESAGLWRRWRPKE